MIVSLAAEHRASLVELLGATPEFTREEVETALEVLDAYLSGDEGYCAWVDVETEVRGYICYGRTPMTEATYDLYWIAVAPSHKGRGIGRALMAKMETELAHAGARLLRVETESTEAYRATRAFYEALGYSRAATLRDFYAAGKDLVIFTRYF
jgi:ribosomal protein S18 acetylase RimI-like enzyme